jgi:hypothetical protein
MSPTRFRVVVVLCALDGTALIFAACALFENAAWVAGTACVLAAMPTFAGPVRFRRFLRQKEREDRAEIRLLEERVDVVRRKLATSLRTYPGGGAARARAAEARRPVGP